MTLAASPASRSIRISPDLVRIAIHLLLAVIFIGSALFVDGFLSARNLSNVAVQSAALALLALGQTFVIAAGMIDLSVGQTMALVAVLICDFMQGASAYAAPAVGLALLVGAGVGAANGVLINTLRVHPLILTFGMMSVVQGAIFVYTDRSIGLAAPEIIWLANGTVAGVPVSAVIVVAAALLAGYGLQRTRFGLHLRAVGANAEGARRAGISLRRFRFVAFTLAGLAAGAAGVIIAGRLGTGYPNVGEGFELDSIVAVVLGGTSLAGGRATIAGTISAVLILGITSNVLNLLEIQAFVQMVVKGLIVVLAVSLGALQVRAEGNR
jgi:ribose/xylose/arabinose/galactoside ABC-type transport system permease subunit